jgi:P-type Cu+ transporter
MIAAAKPSTDVMRLAVSGMTCAGCATAVSRLLSRVPGVTEAQVTLETGRADVAGSATSTDLLATLRRAGYGAELLAS